MSIIIDKETEALITLVKLTQDDVENGSTMSSEEFKRRLAAKRKPSTMLQEALEVADEIKDNITE